MVIGIDNVQLSGIGSYTDLSKYSDKDEKYAQAVDHKIDLIITDNKEIANYFRDNGIAAFLKV